MLNTADIALVIASVLMSLLFTLIRTNDGAPFYSLDAVMRGELRHLYLKIEQIPHGYPWCIRMIGVPCMVRNWSGVMALMLAGIYGFTNRKAPSHIITLLLVLISVAVVVLVSSVFMNLYTMCRYLMPLQAIGFISWIRRSKSEYVDLRGKARTTLSQMITKVLRK